MSVTYEDNNNKEFTNSSHVEGRRKPTAAYIYIQASWLPYANKEYYIYIYIYIYIANAEKQHGDQPPSLNLKLLISSYLLQVESQNLMFSSVFDARQFMLYVVNV